MPILMKSLFTVPSFLVIFLSASYFLDVPKSIIFNGEFCDSLANNIFSGFKSRCTIFYS